MLTMVRIWILLSALLVGAGWGLSALHELNRLGYGIIFALAGLTVICWRRNSVGSLRQNAWKAFHKFRRRCGRPAPLLYFALAVMSLVAGSLYYHSNGDSNAYRIPRVWHWLGSEQWHWIHTGDLRMNAVATGFEWWSAPLMLFTGTDRCLFLLNWVSYLMLPGLIFSVFTRLQIRPRAAWWWMWFLAAGWCFVVQAGSDANDSFAAIYILAAVDLALRARESGRASDFWLSMLAAGLATGVKQNNIPLALFWLAAAWPSRRFVLERPATAVLVAGASLLVSAVPTTLQNITHAGNWQGLPEGTAHSLWSAGSSVWKFVGNLFSIPAQNLVPPFFPAASAYNEMITRFLQTPTGAHFKPFERFGQLGAGISEGNAGIGLSLCIFTLISILPARAGRTAVTAASARESEVFFRWLRLAPWLALVLFMVEICSYCDARLLSSYYPCLFPALLAGSRPQQLARRRWWQRLGLATMLLAVAVLAVSRDRPLFPAVTIIGRLEAAHPQSKFLAHLWAAYSWPRSVEQKRIHFRNDLPPDVQLVGYATQFGDAETLLWLPFGSRRVTRVLPEDTPEELWSRGVRYILADDYALAATRMTLEQWLQHYHASVTDQLEFLEDPYRPPGHLYLVRMYPPSEKAGRSAPAITVSAGPP